MQKNTEPRLRGASGGVHRLSAGILVVLSVVGAVLLAYAGLSSAFGAAYIAESSRDFFQKPQPPVLDTADYDRRMLMLALSTSTLPAAVSTTTASTTPPLWPPKTVYPLAGALLPFKRIVAYYGNFHSAQMGVLGEFEEDEVLRRLRAEVAAWEAADPSTPVVPAIEYIDVVAQADAGRDGKYRARMSDSEIDKALAMAKKVGAIVILDVQVGLSTLEEELPLLEPYLALPNVHLALDPEFSMKTGARPGTVIGSFDASDINYASGFLANLVRKHSLPPKILVVHRFTQGMVTNYDKIVVLPEVQIVMNMDGWGPTWKKRGTYEAFIYPEPVQFTGVKIFYKNDLKPPSTGLWSPQDVLELTPRPIYVQYQ